MFHPQIIPQQVYSNNDYKSQLQFIQENLSSYNSQESQFPMKNYQINHNFIETFIIFR